ncbi:hypothetical protein BS47DRAFT_565752 [Hydnum rufescens UP504]|uniref:Uncharacterized protein n=1 Tax=Hydnum rufescens UP504 TaxID=1448309 RepID=A0A9P6B3L4_9AGAM|nr:hypothetical protein BS47DRAFT_565752 [Hydnum rufescens UP504]
MASQSVATLPSLSYAERARKGRNTAPIPGSEQGSLPSTGPFATSQFERAIPRSVLETPNSGLSTPEAFPNDPAAHATVPSANVWITRTQQHRSSPPSETPSTTISTLSASQTPLSISRSSSRKSRSRTDHPHLNDANAWPEVGEATVPVPSRSEKDTPEGSTSASSQRKEKTKWVHVPPSELQAALDANRTHRPVLI